MLTIDPILKSHVRGRLSSRGVVSVELILTLPILLFFTFAIVDLGRFLRSYAWLSQTAYEATRSGGEMAQNEAAGAVRMDEVANLFFQTLNNDFVSSGFSSKYATIPAEGLVAASLKVSHRLLYLVPTGFKMEVGIVAGTYVPQTTVGLGDFGPPREGKTYDALGSECSTGMCPTAPTCNRLDQSTCS